MFNSVRANGWEHTTVPIAALYSALSDESADIRTRAANSLGYHRRREVVMRLLSMIESGEPVARVRQAAFQSMGQIGDEVALDSLERCIAKEKEVSVRTTCAGALSGIISTRSSLLAIEALRDPSPSVVNQAIASLGSFNSEEARKSLVKIIDEGDPILSLRAISALGMTGNPKATEDLLPLIDVEVDENRLIEVLKAVTRLGGSTVSNAVRAVYTSTESDRVRRYALMALSSAQDSGAGRYAVDALQSEDPLVRLQALSIMREAGDKQGVAPLVAAGLKQGTNIYARSQEWLESHPHQAILELALLNEFLRTAIAIDPERGFKLFAMAAESVNVARNTPSLLQVAEGFYRARWQALYGIGYAHDHDAEGILIEAVTDHDPRIRAVTVRSMGVFGASHFHPQLVGALDDNSAEVRWTTARVLGRHARTEDAPLLMSLLDDQHAVVRKEAVLSLGYLGSELAIDELENMHQSDADPLVREAASFALSLIN